MKYALLGGWGYLGANLAQEMNSCVIARKSSVEKRPFLREAFEGKEVYVLDEITRNGLKEVLQNCGADVLVYVIGKLKGSKKAMYEAHVTKAVEAAEVAKEMGLKFVYISSVAAMGLAEKCADEQLRVFEEEEHLKGCVPVGPYSETKAIGEKEVLKVYPQAGIVRPSAIWGKWPYYVEWKFLLMAKKYRIPVPNVSAVTIDCIVKAIEESLKGGWVIASNTTLKELGFKAFDWRPSLRIIELIPGFMKVSLIAMRYRFASKRVNC